MEENKCLYSDCYIPLAMQELIDKTTHKIESNTQDKLIYGMLKKGTEMLPTYN